MILGRTTRIFITGFLIGAIAPFLVSAFATLVSFDIGVKLAMIFAPATWMADRWPDPLVPLANGFLYGCVACAVTFLLRSASR